MGRSRLQRRGYFTFPYRVHCPVASARLSPSGVTPVPTTVRRHSYQPPVSGASLLRPKRTSPVSAPVARSTSKRKRSSCSRTGSEPRIVPEKICVPVVHERVVREVERGCRMVQDIALDIAAQLDDVGTALDPAVRGRLLRVDDGRGEIVHGSSRNSRVGRGGAGADAFLCRCDRSTRMSRGRS